MSKLQVGKTYLTRSGQQVVLTAEEGGKETPIRFVGECNGFTRKYDPMGYSMSNISADDIVDMVDDGLPKVDTPERDDDPVHPQSDTLLLYGVLYPSHEFLSVKDRLRAEIHAKSSGVVSRSIPRAKVLVLEIDENLNVISAKSQEP